MESCRLGGRPDMRAGALKLVQENMQIVEINVAIGLRLTLFAIRSWGIVRRGQISSVPFAFGAKLCPEAL